MGNHAIVAFVPPPALSRALLATPGASETLDEQHITVFYLGLAPNVDADALLAATRQWAAATPPLRGHLTGLGAFHNPTENVIYAGWTFPDAGPHRERLRAALTSHGLTPPNTYPVWVPHQTLAYTPVPTPPPPYLPAGVTPGTDVEFTSVVVVHGDTWTTVPLGPARPRCTAANCPAPADCDHACWAAETTPGLGAPRVPSTECPVCTYVACAPVGCLGLCEGLTPRHLPVPPPETP